MRRLLLLCAIILSVSAQAQTDSIPSAPQLRFGYLSCDSALRAMPQYAIVQHQMAELRAAYQAELHRVEDEFNQKYEAFLEGQRDFPRTILLKRQNELQQLMQQNLEFKAQGQRDLQRAEAEAMKPLHHRLNEVLATIASECGYALIINTDANACPFIDPTMGEDIQEEARMKLIIDN